MKRLNLITQDPKILSGKPIIKGTRMSVEVILEFLAGGMEIKDIFKWVLLRLNFLVGLHKPQVDFLLTTRGNYITRQRTEF